MKIVVLEEIPKDRIGITSVDQHRIYAFVDHVNRIWKVGRVYERKYAFFSYHNSYSHIFLANGLIESIKIAIEADNEVICFTSALEFNDWVGYHLKNREENK